MDRLAWLDTIFASIHPQVNRLGPILVVISTNTSYQDPEIRNVAPRIMDVLSQRLESEYMRISMANPRDPSLHKIPLLVRRARELKELSRV